jgi:hypothetical protein
VCYVVLLWVCGATTTLFNYFWGGGVCVWGGGGGGGGGGPPEGWRNLPDEGCIPEYGGGPIDLRRLEIEISPLSVLALVQCVAVVLAWHFNAGGQVPTGDGFSAI